jgi:hypothetical protein
MQKIVYRLVEYKITENGHGDLWWETHMGLGSLKIGKCFINGDILFLSPSDNIEPGFLKGEFLDHLNKLPKWEKTKYYCASYRICRCQSVSKRSLFEGAKSRPQNEAILRKNEFIQKEVSNIAERKPFKVDRLKHISYKLQRYEIREQSNGQLFWKSYDGLGRLKKGRCHIKGSILFLEPGETELSDHSKKEFLLQLNSLPDWDRTKYFCASYAIYYAKTGAVCRSLSGDKAVNVTGTKNIDVSEKSFGAREYLKPSILTIIFAKDKITAFFKFSIILAMLILRLLLGCFQTIYKAITAITGKWTLFRN